MDSTKRGDYYHGLYLGVLRGAGPSPRVIVKFHFEEKHKFTYDEWWFDTSIKENCGFFRGHFDTKLNDIIIFHKDKVVPKDVPLDQLFPMEFELTFEVKLIQQLPKDVNVEQLPKVPVVQKLTYAQRKLAQIRAQRDALIQQELNKH